MNEIDIGKIKVPYRIEWSNKRETVGLSLSPEKELTVKAPRTASLEEVDSFLEEKKEWILDKFTGFDKQDRPPKEKEFLSGEKLLYNGRRYLLKMLKKEEGNPELSFKLGKFFLYMPEYSNEEKRKKAAKDTIISWYKKKANKKLPERSFKYANEMEIQIEGVLRKSFQYPVFRLILYQLGKFPANFLMLFNSPERSSSKNFSFI